MDPSEAGAVEAARRRVRRAGGLLKEAVRDLTALTEGQTVLGTPRVHNADTKRSVLELIEFGIGRYGAVDVVVIARPIGRHRHTPHGPDHPGAKEQQHAQPSEVPTDRR